MNQDLMVFVYFCIGFINFMLPRKTLTECTNLFLRNDFKKNDDIILNYFMSNIQKMDNLNKTPNIYPNLNDNISNEQQFRLKNQ